MPLSFLDPVSPTTASMRYKPYTKSVILLFILCNMQKEYIIYNSGIYSTQRDAINHVSRHPLAIKNYYQICVCLDQHIIIVVTSSLLSNQPHVRHNKSCHKFTAYNKLAIHIISTTADVLTRFVSSITIHAIVSQ